MRAIVDLIATATETCTAALTRYADRDWRSVLAADLEWTCWDTALHISDDLYFYAVQLIYGGLGRDDYLHTELAADPGTTVTHLLDAITVHGALLAGIILATDDNVRAFHAYGLSDPTGFAAMAVTEMLIHTYDIVHGLDSGSSWRPPADLADPVLPMLFPEAPPGDPSDVLLYCCGRIALGDIPRQHDWRWNVQISN